MATSGLFTPGSIIAGRYRLVALLGRGGMGDVYRADDLTLDQPVALKFLPEGVARDNERLAQFHNELRTARQVSHKNICRLYDIGEAEARRFLTMEYVDGEDLRVLLRRIGRFPQDRAIALARQLCAGVSAAHEKGIIHRDLKPANVMIDGEGNVRITDFGIATAAADTGGGLAGTPQYMAPEQLAGQPASTRTDIYALGLILFEIFTGKPAYDAKTIAGLKTLHDTGTVTTPSSIVRDLDPAVERIILRCLDREPGRRPGSALAVAAALPGGDPLADALAAGETPSPELLVAAGESEAMPVPQALGAAVTIVLALVTFAAVAPKASYSGLVPFDKPTDALADRAEQIIEALGYSDPVGDRARGFAIPPDYPRWAQQTGPADWWTLLRSGSPPALLFWYRTSPRDLVPDSPGGTVTAVDPPSTQSGMRSAVLDTRGRLVEFHSVPPQVEADAKPAAPLDWHALFAAAGLDYSAFTPTPSLWTPRDFADVRAAWEGPLVDRPDIRVRVEAAAYRGRPASLYIVGPWSRPTRMEPLQRTTLQAVTSAVNVGMWVLVTAGAALLARYNLRANRADRRSAARLAIGLMLAEVVGWLVGSHHVGTADIELRQLTFEVAIAAYLTGSVWVLYLAIEPYARRFWPDGLLGWTRLLSGHVRDARVGRDVLIGMLLGCFTFTSEAARALLPPQLGHPAPLPPFGNTVSPLASSSVLLSRWIGNFYGALQSALFIAMIFVVLRLVLRRSWLASIVGIVIITAVSDGGQALTGSWIDTIFLAAVVTLATFAVFRFGLLVLTVGFFVDNLVTNLPMTLHASVWWATPSNLTLLLTIGLAAFGFYSARAGQTLFGNLEPGS